MSIRSPKRVFNHSIFLAASEYRNWLKYTSLPMFYLHSVFVLSLPSEELCWRSLVIDMCVFVRESKADERDADFMCVGAL